jgi:heme oxygenase
MLTSRCQVGFGISGRCTDVASAALLVPPGGTTLALLDRETRSLHGEVDRGWVRLRRDDNATRDDYLHQLTMTYGFESSYEAACSYTPGVGQAVDLRGRWRSGLLAQDLLALGCTAHDLEAMRCYPLAPFQDAAEALAWMYVVERPTLFHEDVRDELVSRFVDLARATTYLGAYEGAVSKRWAELGIALDLLCVSDKVCKRVVEAAGAGFRALLEWQRTSNPALRNVG